MLVAAASGVTSAEQPPEAPDGAIVLYLEHCAGCHGADKAGRGGSELFVTLMRDRGELSIKQTLHFGTSTGMPNWGTSGALSDSELETLAAYLLQGQKELGPPLHIEFDMARVRASWVTTQPVSERPRRSQAEVSPDDLFVSLLHDTAGILFIDGVTKKVLNREPTGVAPHVLERSPDGRYLYVLGRGGELSMLDLFSTRPTTVASVRVGFEARSMAITGRGRNARLLVAAQTPGQLLSLDPATLEPMFRVEIPGWRDASSTEQQGRGPRAVQIIGTETRQGRFLLVTDSPGVIHIGYLKPGGAPLLLPAIATASSLGPGVLIGNGGGALALFPTQTNAVTSLQPFRDNPATSKSQIVTPPDFRSAGSGTLFSTSDRQHYWLTASLVSPGAVVLAHSGQLNGHWRLHKQLDSLSAGSLFVATHPASDNLWLDAPASPEPALGGSVRVLSKAQLVAGGEVRDRSIRPTILPVAEWIDLGGDSVRVVHPQFNRVGDEVWLTVWNRQDRRSAVVVMDDRTKQIKTVIEDNRLVTPIRTYSLAGLQR